MVYKVEGTEYSWSYQELREEYLRFVAMTDRQFLANVPAAAHLACFICYIKEIPGYVALCDQGIVHELIHLLHLPETCGRDIKRIRRTFKTQLELA